MKYRGADSVELSSGRLIHVYAGVFGLTTEGALTYGYDDRSFDDTDFSPEERLEIATEMIARWTKWATEGQP